MSFLQNVSFIISTNHFEELPVDIGKEIAFAGRSNAGKSSAINSLTNKTRLAYVSKQPGRTQLINFFKIQDMQSLVDLPGYGFAKVSQSSRRRWEQMIENYLRKRPNLNRVFVLIDSRHEPQKIDLEFIEQKPVIMPSALVLSCSSS